MRRLELGDLRQEDIAERTNDLVSPGTVSDLERGKATLDGLPTKRAAALAQALEWTLLEMQEATGVSLGLSPELLGASLEKVADQFAPVYPIAAAANPSLPAYPNVVEALRGTSHPANMRVFVASSNEMASTSRQSIQEGDHLYTDLDDTRDLRERYIYVITSGGQAYVRRWADTPFGFAWVPDNKDHPTIPPSQAEVVGRVYRVVGDRSDKKLVN